ncbi:hypothetical protein Tco_0452115 [Tanacetum coccineum]
MLVERRYPLIRETLERMMELRLTTESEGKVVFDLLRFIQKQIDEFRDQDGKLASPEANDFCAPCYSNEALAIPEQTTTGKEISNLFMAGEDCWVLEDFTTYCCWFNIGAASEDLVLMRKIKENRLSLYDLMSSGDGDIDGGSDDEGSAAANSVMHASADGDRGVWG